MTDFKSYLRKYKYRKTLLQTVRRVNVIPYFPPLVLSRACDSYSVKRDLNLITYVYIQTDGCSYPVSSDSPDTGWWNIPDCAAVSADHSLSPASWPEALQTSDWSAGISEGFRLLDRHLDCWPDRQTRHITHTHHSLLKMWSDWVCVTYIRCVLHQSLLSVENVFDTANQLQRTWVICALQIQQHFPNSSHKTNFYDVQTTKDTIITKQYEMKLKII